MWLTRFQDRSSVITKTKFGRSWMAGLGWVAAGEEQPVTAARAMTRRPITALVSLPVLGADGSARTQECY